MLKRAGGAKRPRAPPRFFADSPMPALVQPPRSRISRRGVARRASCARGARLATSEAADGPADPAGDEVAEFCADLVLAQEREPGPEVVLRRVVFKGLVTATGRCLNSGCR